MTAELDAIRRHAIAQSKNTEVGSIEEIFAMIDEVIQLSVLGRTCGLLALEEYIKDRPKDSLHAQDVELLGNLIVDAVEPKLIEEVMANRYWVHDLKGYHALHLFGYIYGMLMVQQGENPRLIKTMLTSLLEDADVVAYEKHFEEHPEIMKASRPHFGAGSTEKKEKPPVVDIFSAEEMAELFGMLKDDEDE